MRLQLLSVLLSVVPVPVGVRHVKWDPLAHFLGTSRRLVRRDCSNYGGPASSGEGTIRWQHLLQLLRLVYGKCDQTRLVPHWDIRVALALVD